MIGHTDEEIPGPLEVRSRFIQMEEMLYAATLYNDLDTKQAIYQRQQTNIPDSFRAQNNLGYVYVQMNKPDKAQSCI